MGLAAPSAGERWEGTGKDSSLRDAALWRLLPPVLGSQERLHPGFGGGSSYTCALPRLLGGRLAAWPVSDPGAALLAQGGASLRRGVTLSVTLSCSPGGPKSSFTRGAAPGLLGLWRAGQVLPEVGALRPGTCRRRRRPETGTGPAHTAVSRSL